MKRKRFVKLLMASGCSRNEAGMAARRLRGLRFKISGVEMPASYALVFGALLHAAEKMASEEVSDGS